MADYNIINRWALGDTVMLSALVRDIALEYHGQHKIAMTGHYVSYWQNNPYVTPAQQIGHARPLRFECTTGIARSKAGEKMHYVSWFHKEFERLTGLHVPCRKPKGDYHLSKQEQRPSVSGRYWVVIAGGKLDMTAKWWYYHRYQEVVDLLLEQGVHCVQAGAHFTKHVHPALKNCLDVTAVTEQMRDLVALIAHSEGVICGITGPMHIAAMFDKPCVVVAGGREEPWWEAYVNNYDAFGPQCEPVEVPHKFLHTVGLLDCGMGNLNSGCWRSRTVPIEPADTTKDGQAKLCTQPHRNPVQTVPKCMDLITVDHVVEAVMDYYEKGILPPIGTPKGTYRKGIPAEATTVLVNQETLEDLKKFGQNEGSFVAPDERPPVTIVPGSYPLVDPDGKQVGFSNQQYHSTPATEPNAIHALWRQSVPELPQLLVEGRVKRSPPPPAEYQQPKGEDPAFKLLDNPTIGGKFTFCLLGYGDHFGIFKKCLESILNTVPEHRREIRVALNQPCPATFAYVQDMYAERHISRYYHDESPPDQPRRKYPAMRQMFYDTKCPLATKFLIWMDDDTAAIDPMWIIRLTETILDNHRHGVRMYGKKMFHDLQIYHQPHGPRVHDPKHWFETAPWWKGEMLRLKGMERLAPNGSCIDFCAGWFWAAHVESLLRAGVPDERLNHNGGDITIGAQMHQAGFKIKDFNRDKQFIYTPDKAHGGRRGYSEAFPWADPASQAKHKVGS
jgi:hypothetical protein